jgi:hypothetical protein
MAVAHSCSAWEANQIWTAINLAEVPVSLGMHERRTKGIPASYTESLSCPVSEATEETPQ